MAVANMPLSCFDHTCVLLMMIVMQAKVSMLEVKRKDGTDGQGLTY